MSQGNEGRVLRFPSLRAAAAEDGAPQSPCSAREATALRTVHRRWSSPTRQARDICSPMSQARDSLHSRGDLLQPKIKKEEGRSNTSPWERAGVGGAAEWRGLG